MERIEEERRRGWGRGLCRLWMCRIVGDGLGGSLLGDEDGDG